MAGSMDMNSLVLTYLSERLEPLVGLNRQDPGDPLLESDEAFDAALNCLYHAAPIGIMGFTTWTDE